MEGEYKPSSLKDERRLHIGTLIHQLLSNLYLIFNLQTFKLLIKIKNKNFCNENIVNKELSIHEFSSKNKANK